ncbi:MAG TPA: hypothetical protein PKL15_18655, partial [Saprospiraceae bacterium]|nr:hypothetical protein [Saprospiraceae bacterium]
MQNRKLFQLLGTLSPNERRRFRKWLLSPIHNPNNTLSKFYNIIDSRSVWTARSLNAQKIFARLFAGKEYDDLVIRRLLSELLEQLEQFLLYENW